MTLDLTLVREAEKAFAREAAAHAAAAAELNPLSEAEVLPLGSAMAVYSGQCSPVHGVYALGLDGPVEPGELREIERFYLRKERAPVFWLSPACDPSFAELLRPEYHALRSVPVHALRLGGAADPRLLPDPRGSNQPDPSSWPLLFTRTLAPAAAEPGLLSFTKLHQRQTRFYAAPDSGASYSFFSDRVALVPHPGPAALLALQLKDAADWGAGLFVCGGPCPLPLAYERTLHARL